MSCSGCSILHGINPPNYKKKKKKKKNCEKNCLKEQNQQPYIENERSD